MRVIRFIIPTFKKHEQVEECLAAIDALEHDQKDRIEIVTVDNNDFNHGFTAAVNEGLRVSILNGDEYAVILNQDCYLDKKALVRMLAFMDDKKFCAIAGIKQISSDDPDLIIHGGCTEAYPNGRHLSGYVSKGDCALNRQMPWVNAACLIVRVKYIMEFGLMDENMFLVGSDSDWCYTARSRGYEVWYIADAICVHEQGVTSGTEDKGLQKQMYIDMIYWRNKWIGTDLYRELTMEVFE